MMHGGTGVEVGDVLAGKYRVEKVLGAGGMGIVVAVFHLHLDQQFAIKLMLPEMLGSSDAVARFLREARAAAKIKSEHVVRVFDVDSLANGAPYMLMELLEGRDVATLLRESGPLDVEGAVDLVLQMCEVVADAHALGIVHRDLKPSNLFAARGSEGQVSIKVLDFGISKVTTGAGAGLDMTRTAESMGSPLYMSPEQMESARDVDGRTDIWAIGVILFELLAGRVPFVGKTPVEVGIKIVGQAPPRLSDLRRETPPGLDAVVMKCLEKDPARRFASVGALAAALAPFAPPRSRPSLDRIARGSVPSERTAEPARIGTNAFAYSTVEGTQTAMPAAAPTLPSPVPNVREPSSMRTAPPAWGTTTPPRKGRKIGAGAGLAGVVMLVGGFAVLATRTPAPPRATPAEEPAPPAAAATPPSAPAMVHAPATIGAPADEVTPAAQAVPADPVIREPTVPSPPLAENAKHDEVPSPALRKSKPAKPARAGSSATVAPGEPPTSAPPAPSSSALRPGVWQDRK